MVRKIKFPLVMKNGAEVRGIEGLKENFDLESIVTYFLNGKLKIWLQQRNYINELELVIKLQDSNNQEDIAKKLCEIFNVQVQENINIEEIKLKKEREKKLLQYTDDETWKEKLDYIAFNQEELEKLIKNNSIIYLVGEEFIISNKFSNREYIGVNNPLINLEFREEYKNNEKSIVIKNSRLLSKRKIKIYADISENCDLQGNNIYTNGKFIENIRFVDIEEFELNCRYPLKKSKDIFLFYNDLIYSFLQSIEVISLSSLKVINKVDNEEYSISESGSIYNTKLILARESSKDNTIEIRDILTLEKEKIYVGLKDELIKTLKLDICDKKEIIVNENYIDIYTYYDCVFNWIRLDAESGVAIIKKSKNIYSKYENFDRDGENVYIVNSFDFENRLICFNNDKEVELANPLEDYKGDDIVGYPHNVRKYIVSNGKLLTVWEDEYIGEFGGISDIYTIDRFIVVYDLKTGEKIDRFEAHKFSIIYMKKVKDVLLTIDNKSILKLWSLDNLEIIGELRLYESMSHYDYYERCEYIKDIYVNYDEVSDRILVRFFEKIIILG